VFPPSGQLIHPTSRLLIQFIADVGLDPALSTYASRAYDRLCGSSLKRFADGNLYLMPSSGSSNSDFRDFYTSVNFLAHLVNLGYLSMEDVQDHILQSLSFQPTAHPHQLFSLAIFLKISGATFAAYVDPTVMDRCCNLLKSSHLGIIAGLKKVRVQILKIRIDYEHWGL